MHLLRLALTLALFYPIFQEENECLSPISQWRRSKQLKTTNVVHVIAGRNVSLECDAYAKLLLAPKDTCSNVQIVWRKIIGEQGESAAEVGFWTMQMNDTSRVETIFTGKSRFFADGKYLHISYAQNGKDDGTYYCELIRSSPTVDRAFSAVTLHVDKCPELVRKKYKGGPCHHGKCSLVNKTETIGSQSIPVIALTCSCLPGYKGEFCDEEKYWPWLWMIVTWTPGGLGLVCLVGGVLVYKYGKKELIFKEAELLSPHLKVG